MFELIVYPHQNAIWKHKLIPIEVNKNDSDRVFDLLVYKRHYVLNKKLNLIFGNHKRNYVCSRCLNSYTCQNMFNKHTEKCEQKQEKTIIMKFRRNSSILEKSL